MWWSIVHSTRTQHFLTSDRLGIVREVEVEHDPIIKDVDRVDKGINDLPLVFRTAHVTITSCPQPIQRMRKSIPERSTKKRLFPHG